MADVSNKSLPRRKVLRIPGYDYSQPGAYFVTICTNERKNLFGEIRNGIVGLNSLGCLAAQCWKDIPNHFNNVRLDEFVIMPNHLHGILFLSDRTGTACRAPTDESFGKPQSGSLSTIIRFFKSVVTKSYRELFDEQIDSPWHRGYFEHIIRDDKSLLKIQEYIQTNPQRWQLDRENLLKSNECDEFDLWLESFKDLPCVQTGIRRGGPTCPPGWPI